MASPKATGSESEGLDSVTERFKASSEAPPRPGSIASDKGRILSDHNARAKCSNNPQELTAEALVLAVTAPHGCAVGVAWVASANDVNFPLLWIARWERPHRS